MKKSILLLLSALAFFSCSETEITPPNNGMEGDVGHSFLSVTIVPSQTSGTRAGDDEYRDGTDVENEVTSIRFYFFDKDGKAAAVKSNGASYYDVQGDEIEQKGSEDNVGPVESVVSSIIVIEQPKGDGKPVYMAAVLNHNDQAPKEVANIAALQEYVANYSSHIQGTFTMSSSVYKGTRKDYTEVTDGGEDMKQNGETSNVEIVAVPVYDKIKTTREAALAEPATIYVERVLAKVSASIGIDKETNITVGNEMLYKVGYVGSQAKDQASDAKTIYVKFLGWNVTADRNNSRLVKKINTEWNMGTDNQTWRITSWNQGDFFRSFWAINPENESSSKPIDDNYNFSPFAQKITSSSSATWGVDEEGKRAWSFKFDNKDCAYLQENAGKYKDGTGNDIINSKIIVAAQLVDETGAPLDLIEWQGDIYEKSDNVLDALAADTYLYIYEEDKESWRKLNHNDIEIEFTNEPNADVAYEKNENGEKRYYVHLKLTNAKGKYAIYKYFSTTADENEPDNSKWDLDKGTDDQGYAFNASEVATALKSVGYIKYWNTGYTYYWVDIKHFGNEGQTGEYGVVRNHWYEYKFTDVKGLGVPVANPDEIIYPEEPGEPEFYYLAAEVKILSWRMVYNPNTSLGWE